MANSVIHKQVIDLDTVRAMSVVGKSDIQTYEVPVDAEMVDIDWDTRNPTGIAFWYTTRMPNEDEPGPDVKFWRMVIRGTGEPFPARMTHMTTVVRDGFAWHVLDADGGHINWGKL